MHMNSDHWTYGLGFIPTPNSTKHTTRYIAGASSHGFRTTTNRSDFSCRKFRVSLQPLRLELPQNKQRAVLILVVEVLAVFDGTQVTFQYL
jgi:hypothetical protein